LDAAPAQRRICIVGNARSGANGKGLAETLAPWLGNGPDRVVDLRLVSNPKLLERIVDDVAAQGYDCVVAAGGDGTVNAVARALADTGIEMGIVPLGTFNYFARGLGLPQDVPGAMDAILSGRARAVSVGRINDRVFLNNASFGIYPAILRQRERTYARWGRSRTLAFLAVMQTMMRFRRPFRVRATVDGTVERLKTPTAFVAFNAYQLREFGMEGAECIDGGKLALLTAPDTGKPALIWNLVRIMLRRGRKGQDFALSSGTDILMETRRRRAVVAIDGERMVLGAPFRIGVARDALRVLLPVDGA